MKRKKSLLRCVEPYLYLLPAVVLFVLFVYYPFLKNEVLSFFTLDKFRTVKEFAGIQNYVRVFGDEKFLLAVKNTLIYVAVTVPVSMVLGYFLALLCRKVCGTGCHFTDYILRPDFLYAAVGDPDKRSASDTGLHLSGKLYKGCDPDGYFPLYVQLLYCSLCIKRSPDRYLQLRGLFLRIF